MPKIAGIESSANSRSVVPSVRITMTSGVITRTPFSLVKILRPCHSLVAGKRFSTSRTSRFSSYSSSSSAPSLASFQAV